MGLAQIGGAAVVDIADILDRLAHLERGLRPDQPAALQHERYRRFGHAGLARDVQDRRLGPAGHIRAFLRVRCQNYWNVLNFLLNQSQSGFSLNSKN